MKKFALSLCLLTLAPLSALADEAQPQTAASPTPETSAPKQDHQLERSSHDLEHQLRLKLKQQMNSQTRERREDMSKERQNKDQKAD